MSRLPVYLLFALLIGAIFFLIFKQSAVTDSSKQVTELVPIEKALKNMRATNIRSNATVSVDSCKEAEKAFQQLTNNQSSKADNNKAIEKLLMDLMQQVTKEGSTEMHLSCLLHRLPSNKRYPKT